MREALERTTKDPFLKGALKMTNQSAENQNKFLFVPPRGAIAHSVISGWLEGNY